MVIPKRRYPWIAQQHWADILFIHQPATYETLRPFIPYPLEIDTYDNKGWMSIVLFTATQSRLRFMPTFLSFPRFYQMNVRTYVRFGDERGVYFFTIHVNNHAVTLGGHFTGLPFVKAQMMIHQEEDKLLFEASRLFDHPQSKFHISYQPKSHHIDMHTDSLAHFLAERYAIWMRKGQTIVKAPIFHEGWNLQTVDTSILNFKHLPFSLTEDTIYHYADFKHTFIHPFEKAAKVSS